MQKEKELLRYLVENGDGELTQCELVFHIICSADKKEQPQLLEWFVIYNMMAKRACAITFDSCIQEVEAARIKSSYSRLVGRIINALLKSNPTEHEFYQRLWPYIIKLNCNADAHERGGVIYACANDPRLPYFKTHKSAGAEISRVKYEGVRNRIGIKEICKLLRIADARFELLSEQAAQLLALIEQQPSKERRIVMMAELIDHYKENSMDSLLSIPIDIDDDDEEDE